MAESKGTTDKTAGGSEAKPVEGPAPGVMSPGASSDPAFKDDPAQGLDPTKVVGTFAEQPDPNDERGAPLPNVPEGVKEAPADDEPNAPAIGDGSQ